jgi:hypothetical protein
MGHFAKVLGGEVINIIKAEPEFFDNFIDSSPGDWIQTSYNTFHGVHQLNGTPLRKNYAAVGYTYDAQRDAFIPPQPFPSWTLNETTCDWDAPTPRPNDDNRYSWNESTTSWVVLE